MENDRERAAGNTHGPRSRFSILNSPFSGLTIAFAVALGLGVRVWLVEQSPRHAYFGDHDDYVRWGIQAADDGVTAFYTAPPPRVKRVVYHDDGTTSLRTRRYDRVLNYPPVSAYLLWLEGELYKGVADERLVNTRTSRRVYAVLPILSDILLAWGCLAVVGVFASRSTSALAFAAVFLAPPLFLDSAFWGQVDAWLLAPAVWMVWAMMRGRWTLAGLLWGVALGVKPQAVLFAAVWGLAFLFTTPRRKVLLGGAVAVAVLNAAALPFWITSGASWFKEAYVGNILFGYPWTTLKAFNLWYIDLLVTEEKSAGVAVLGLAKDHWGKVFAAIGAAVAFYIVYRRWRSVPVGLCLFTGLVLLVSVILPTRVHERYIVLCLPFLICAACRMRRLWPGLVVLVIVASFQVTWYTWSTRLAGSASERHLRAYYGHKADMRGLPAEAKTRYVERETRRELANRAKDRPYEWALTLAALASFVWIMAAAATAVGRTPNGACFARKSSYDASGRETMTAFQRPSSHLLKELVRRILDAVHPLRIILFGSAARGDMGPHSDLDVLVVLPAGAHAACAENEIYRAMWGFGFAKDIIVVTEEDVRKHASNPYLVIHTALTQGKDLYRAVGP